VGFRDLPEHFERLRGGTRAWPDWIVESDLHFARYRQDPQVYPVQAAFYLDLLDGRLPYSLVASFKTVPRWPTLIQAQPSFVNPLILVFKRIGPEATRSGGYAPFHPVGPPGPE